MEKSILSENRIEVGDVRNRLGLNAKGEFITKLILFKSFGDLSLSYVLIIIKPCLSCASWLAKFVVNINEVDLNFSSLIGSGQDG